MEYTDFQDIRKKIFANGKIDESDVALLREVIFTGELTLAKGNFLFDIKDSTDRNNQCSAFKDLFIEAITDLLLKDEDSPGEIDENEAKWLRAKIRFKGYTDKTDELLIKNIKSKSINWPKVLNFKSKTVKNFEQSLYFSRYLTLLAVVGSLIAAIVLFVLSTVNIYNALKEYIFPLNVVDHQGLEHLLAMFVTSVDVYLFAMVLIIFGMGVYELFINKMDPVENRMDSRPSWLRISSIDDLKSSLGKVILMVLIVSIFEHSLSIDFNSSVDLLYAAIAVVLVAVALYVTHLSSHKDDKKVESEEN